MHRKIIVYSVFLFSVQAFGQSLATVGDHTISKKEFQKSYKEAIKNSQNFSRPPSKKEHLEDMVRFKAGLIEAEKTNLRNHPRVKKALELELYKGLLETQLGSKVDKISVSENEMKNYYNRYPQMRSSHILFRFPINASKEQIAEARSRALKAYKDISSGRKKWSVYVRAYSDDDQTKTLGGDIGYHTSESIYPSYYNTLKSLKMGEISAPVQGLYGFHIIKKTGQYSYERANKNLIKMSVFNQKRYSLLDKYFETLKKKYKVSYNNDLL